jgi:hypothetical protein
VKCRMNMTFVLCGLLVFQLDFNKVGWMGVETNGGIHRLM